MSQPNPRREGAPAIAAGALLSFGLVGPELVFLVCFPRPFGCFPVELGEGVVVERVPAVVVFDGHGHDGVEEVRPQ